jgi:cytochrome c peroxidase
VFEPEDEEGVPLDSLKRVQVPLGVDRLSNASLAPGGRFIRSQTALVQLGKALFWDQQVGSDGQSCGTCHFSAGADARVHNQGSPGLKATPVDHTFQHTLGPNHTLTTADFPLHKLSNPDNRLSTVLSDSNDTIASAGVFNRDFTSIQVNSGGLTAPRPLFDQRAFDVCRSVADTEGFAINGINTRRVEPRNTPTMINAMFSNRNFWDSRAQDVFNGVNPFGARDTGAVVFDNPSLTDGLPPAPVHIQITFSSLASQAVGPPLSEFEMSCRNRTFPDLGNKMLSQIQTPLAQQVVAADDSRLGDISNNRATGGRIQQGLTRSYRQLVSDAFQPRWWAANSLVTVNGQQRPQIEANFSMFWGLAVQAYMQTLRADDSRVDRFFETSFPNRLNILSSSEVRGLQLFESAFGTRPSIGNDRTVRVTAPTVGNGQPADLRCTACHGGAETTAASIDAVRNDARLERMAQLPVNGQDRCAIYDAGHFHTGVRRVADDPGLGGVDPFGNSFGETAVLLRQTFSGGPSLTDLVPTAVAPFGLIPSLTTMQNGKVVPSTTNCSLGADNVNGTFKAPGLRNVSLTGPYFHNGDSLTLRQVVDFYNRGGNFQDQREFDPNVHRLNLTAANKTDLVNFLIALTDDRVARERDPFDHPSICVPDGHPGSETSTMVGPQLPGDGPAPRALFNVRCVDASGRNGLSAPLRPFLGVNQQDPTP